jgi:hypothetical protein
MVSKIKMGLKPLNHLQLANPFTEVNGNLCINFKIYFRLLKLTDFGTLMGTFLAPL